MPASPAHAQDAAIAGDEMCLYVLGMHRSGTSAVAGSLPHLGLALTREDDLLPASPGNSLGHWESRSLLVLGDRVLEALGGSWDAPPDLDWGWNEAPAIAPLKVEALSLLPRVLGGRPAAWKDPRTCLLLPFWRPLVRRPSAAVLVYRHPLEVATSLARRDGIDLAHGLALWERYNLAALANLEGLPVLVVAYEAVLTDPGGWAKALASFLEDLGVELAPPTPGALDSFLADDMRHERAGPDAANRPLLSSQQEILSVLDDHRGAHGSWSVPALPDESPWSAGRLSAQSDLQSYRRGLSWSLDQLSGLLASALSAEVPSPSYPLNAAEDTDAYRSWYPRHRVRVAQAAASARASKALAGAAPTLVSVVVPVHRPELWYLRRAIESVKAQTWVHWELCLCDDASGDAELTALLAEEAAADPRVRLSALERNGGISAATNRAISTCRGELVAFVDHDDELVPEALERMVSTFAERPDTDVAYSDEDKLDLSGQPCQPTFKPDWSPDWLLSHPYTCHLTVMRRNLVERLGGLRPEFDGSQDYDLALRATEAARAVAHVPEILYHWRIVGGSASYDPKAKPWAYDASRRALLDALDRRGEEASLEHGPFNGTYTVRRAVRGSPLVSVVVPFRDQPGLLRSCVGAVDSLGGYEHVELVLVDNDSEEPETAALLDQLSSRRGTRVLSAPGPFNWSAINNVAVASAEGSLLLFLNNDVEGRRPGWLRALVEHAQRHEVGAVGGRLLYPDGRVQHVGMVVGMHASTGHVLRGLDGDEPGYMGLAQMTANWSAVTGACIMTARVNFEELGGFDEGLAVAYSDVDYCLRLRQRGYLVVFTPAAEAVHHESETRGRTDDTAEHRRFLERWRQVVVDGDPFFNPNLSRLDPWCALPSEQEEERWTDVISPLR